jgi:single-stranded-DNA-specific exonuclease
MAPLVEENRLLTFMGMRQIMQNSRLGIKALIGTAGFSPDALNAQHISHMIAPRLNAAGRLESALSALSLLLTKDPSEASLKAQELDNQNRLRQQLTHQLEQIALQIAFQEDESPLLLFAVHKEFNLGVIGLVASHLTEKYYRPSIVAVETEDFIRASCRSIPEFNITAALDQCADLMEHHGGHASAAGFTIRKDRFIELKHRLQEIAQAELANRELQPVYKADMELDLSSGISFFNNLQDLQPTGIGNPTPTFITRNVFPHDVKLVGKDQSHLKFRINSAWHCIAFRKGHLIDNLRTNIDILYTIEKQDYNGNTYLQLNIRDIRPSN